MIKTIKHIISLFAITSVLALSFMGCAQPSNPEVKDTVAPAEVSDLKAITGDKKVTLSWTNPTDKDFFNVIITYDGNTTQTQAGGANSIDITGLENGKAYTFKVQTVDKKQNISSGVNVSQYPMNPLTETPTKVSTKTINDKPYDIVKFGDWPQSLKAADINLSSNTTTVNGWTCNYGSDGAYYVKVVATPNNKQDYTFVDGTTKIENNKEYYFKLEPIQWRVLTNDYKIPDVNGNYISSNQKLLFAEKALATHKYHDSSNKYDISDIRNYLTKDFINKAFTPAAIKRINDTGVDNSLQSTLATGEFVTENPYTCDNTTDKIFLLSTKEITMEDDYGFNSSSVAVTKLKQATDFARAKGIWLGFDNKGNATYWLRSPNSEKENSVRNVNYLGYSRGSEASITSAKNLGVVPALTITSYVKQ